MNTRARWFFVCFASLVGSAVVAYAGSAGETFTYQGQLKLASVPVTDSCEFEFSLWQSKFDTHPSAQVGPAVGFFGSDAVSVVSGLFTVVLGFGEGISDGNELFLEIAVRCSSQFDFVALAPRQLMTSAPHAAYAKRTPWYGLLYMPADIADGDDDTTLTESQVENYVIDDPINLATGTSLGGQPTDDHESNCENVGLGRRCAPDRSRLSLDNRATDSNSSSTSTVAGNTCRSSR
jgi:hypothetical protein